MYGPLEGGAGGGGAGMGGAGAGGGAGQAVAGMSAAGSSGAGAGGSGGRGGAGGAAGAAGQVAAGAGGGAAGQGGAGGTSGTAAVQYLIYGIVWGKATIDCPEGSATFDDAKAYYWQIIDGTYSATYSAASAALKTKMMMEHPGERSYFVESSWFTWGKTASHAVIIEYTQDLKAWDCRPYIITKGYGTSYEQALSNALESKADNDSASAPYKELKHLTWTPAK